MAIITISRGCFSHGKDIAEKVAQILGYACISREIIIDASQFFHVSEKKLFKTLHDAPGLMEKFTHGRDEYLSYVQAALMENVRNDNVVYHGYGGHLLLPDVRHILKVRIISDMKTRIAYTMETRDLSYEASAQMIENEDAQRSAWTSTLFGRDMIDPDLYDLVLNIGNMSMDDASRVICDLAQSPSFETSEASGRQMSDAAIKSHARALLYKICQATVHVENGHIRVGVEPTRIKKTSHISPELLDTIWDAEKEHLNRQIIKTLGTIPGVNKVTCEFTSPEVH